MSAILLDHLRDLTVEREASERRVHRALQIGHAMGVGVSDLADAARLSTSRVHAILAGAGRPLRPLTSNEVEHVLEHVESVAVVPANELAYGDYWRYGAYICQARRSFRPETTRLGFYADREIKPEFPQILKTWEEVSLDQHTVSQLKASTDSHDLKLAEILEDVLVTNAGGRKPGSRHKVMLLSPPDDARTLVLQAPIRHLGRGRGQAWVRRQRYTSEAALRRAPKTTDEL